METFAFLATNPPESSVFPRRGRRGSWRDPSYHQRNDRGLVKADAKQQIQRWREVENMYRYIHDIRICSFISLLYDILFSISTGIFSCTEHTEHLHFFSRVFSRGFSRVFWCRV